MFLNLSNWKYVFIFLFLSLQLISAKTKPNIILCMADDLGWGDVGYNGHPHIKTPALDQMSKDGARFDRFYVGTPLCVPSRAGFLTGRIATRVGIHNLKETVVDHLKAEELTIAEMAQECGYTTGHFGKWHLGMLTEDFPGKKEVLMTPGMSGFDEWFSTPSSIPTYNPYVDPGNIGRNSGAKAKYQPTPLNLNEVFIHNGIPYPEKVQGCSAKVVMDKALGFIRDCHNNNKPFLSVIWFNGPHTPVVGHPEIMNELYSSYSENEQHYYSVVTSIDRQMGRLREELKKLGIENNTMLGFTSDNGPGPPISHPIFETSRIKGSSGGHRERKASLYEGGVREPGLLIWPSTIKSGTVIEEPCSTLDYMPTLAKMMNYKLPERPYDGVDLMPMLSGKMESRPKSLKFVFRDAVAITRGPWKLISSKQTKGKRKGQLMDLPNLSFELYHLGKDPYEKNDKVDQYPELVKELKKELIIWLESVDKSQKGEDYAKS